MNLNKYLIEKYDLKRTSEIWTIEKEELINKLNFSESFCARIKALTSWGAYLEIGGMICIIKNKDFNKNSIKISKEYKVGDIISNLNIKKITSFNKILIEKAM